MEEDMGASAEPTGLVGPSDPSPVPGLGHSATIPSAGAWECFRDEAYFGMWCVRRVGSRTFGEGFHIVDGAEAENLRTFLSACEEYERLRQTALEEIAHLPWASGRETPADACTEMQAIARAALEGVHA